MSDVILNGHTETGKKYNRVTILYVLSRREKGKQSRRKAYCKCDCGNEWLTCLHSIKVGKVMSCGCYHAEIASKLLQINCPTIAKHNATKTPEYKCWQHIKERCYTITCKYYKNYGGRGVNVCDRWLDKENGFINFLADMGKKPFKHYSLDRINNNGNYEPLNCRWTSSKVQNNNTRKQSGELIEINCKSCGNLFKRNKYHYQIHCSKQCLDKHRPPRKK